MLRARESKNKLGDKGETALVNQSAPCRLWLLSRGDQVFITSPDF